MLPSKIDGLMSSEQIISLYSCLLCKQNVSVIFFFKMYKVKRNLLLYGMFILRSQRLGNLNCVLSLTVFIKALGLCLALKFCETVQ